MRCLISLKPRIKAYSEFKDMCAEITPEDLEQIESMCANGVNKSNQTFCMDLEFNPVKLQRRNYQLTISYLVKNSQGELEPIIYELDNVMTMERTNTEVEFTTVPNYTVSKQI